MDPYYFTEKGFQKLKEEIDKLERFIKHDIAKEIGTAREHGDLKENANGLQTPELSVKRIYLPIPSRLASVSKFAKSVPVKRTNTRFSAKVKPTSTKELSVTNRR
jgi:hypothetical protein